MMKRVFVVVALVAFAASFAFAEGQQEFPTRDITDVVVWSAGGGTDTTNRVVVGEMQQFLGVNVNVINKPGGVAGSLGMRYGYEQPHDGYTLTGLSESCVTAGVQGGWDKRMTVWDYFIVGGSPDVISVTPDSPYESLEDLIEAAKENPESIKAGASGAGSIHHLNLLALEDGTGAQFNFIPYPGSAPSQNAAMSGEITLVVTSLQEQQQLIRGGKLRPLAMLIEDEFEVKDYGTIPSAFDSYPQLSEYLPISQSIGFAVPDDVPEARKEVLRDAFKKALETDKVQNWAEQNYFLITGETGEEAQERFNQLESLFAWTLWDLGAAQVNPEELGIPKP